MIKKCLCIISVIIIFFISCDAKYIRNPFYFAVSPKIKSTCKCVAIGLVPGTKNAFSILYINNERYMVRVGDQINTYKIVGITNDAVIIQDNAYQEWIIDCDKQSPST